MEENKKSKKGLIIGGACVVLLVAAFALVYALTRPETNKGAKTITVQIVTGENSTKEVEINTDAEYLKGALEEKGLVKGTESGNQFFITEVDGVAADDSKQQWWAISKDGTMADTGAAEIVIKDGDHFELTLKTGY